jgi:hypothetical protein
MKQLHLNDEITNAKKNQAQTNERLDAILWALQETNRLLAAIRAEKATS